MRIYKFTFNLDKLSLRELNILFNIVVDDYVNADEISMEENQEFLSELESLRIAMKKYPLEELYPDWDEILKDREQIFDLKEEKEV